MQRRSPVSSCAVLVLLAFALSWLSAAEARAASCPSTVRFVPDDAGSTFDAGWSGIGHDQPLPLTLDLAVSCAASTPPCGTCTLSGPIASATGHRWRCKNDTSKECTVATEVADCGAPGTCRLYLQPTSSLAVGGVAFCATTEVDGPIAGTVSVESGAFAPTLPLRAILYEGFFGSGEPLQGCPRCDADPIPNDGVRAGTCSAGPRIGLACDANVISPFPDFGASGFDCPPDPDDRRAEIATTLAFTTTPHSATLTAASPHCTASPWVSSFCFCSTCNSLALQVCASNTDCPPSGGQPGICGGRRCQGGVNAGAPCTTVSACPGSTCSRVGVNSQPHACDSDPNDCTPDGDGGGVCSGGPIDVYCSNHPDRGCIDESDCDDVPGSCGITRFRSCFPDQGVLGGAVAVAGTATPPVDGVAAPTTIGALTCIGPTAEPLVNVWGLPGLARVGETGTLLFDDAALPACPPFPAACRAPVVARKASLQLTDRSPDTKDQLAWKWTRGAATTVEELGQPLTSDAYALCLYDASGLRATMNVPAGGTCGSRPCWQAKSNGFRYRNASGTPNGIVDLSLRAGADGKAQIQAKGKGLALPMPAPMSLTTPVQVQLRNRASGRCWSATYSPPFERATSELLRDHAD